MESRDELIHSRAQLMIAIQNEAQRFKEYHLWLEEAMPELFFSEIKPENVMLIAHSLMGFHLENYYSQINLTGGAIVLCLDSNNADMKILKNFSHYGMSYYCSYISTKPPPIQGIIQNIRIVTMSFTVNVDVDVFLVADEDKSRLKNLVRERNPKVSEGTFDNLFSDMNTRFLKTVNENYLILALDMYFRARTRDQCQYEVRYNEDWKTTGGASMYIVLAWRNTSKANFLYHLSRSIFRHGLVMKRVNATYIDPYANQNILMMVMALHGSNGEAAWNLVNLPDFLKELVTVKYFAQIDDIEKTFVDTQLLRGNMGNFLRALCDFVHQVLVHIDPYFYSLAHIQEALCRHPELIVRLCKAFEYKFHPEKHDIREYRTLRDQYFVLVDNLDTGKVDIDRRRKNVLKQSMNFVEYTLKTNFYRNNKAAFSFHLDPRYLDHAPFKREEFFSELPYAIFFITGMYFIGFHIRFKDLSRGGLRTVFPKRLEFAQLERNEVFMENYSLAYTQHKKNKDIPEGGSKGVIFVEALERLNIEANILAKELKATDIKKEEIEAQVQDFITLQRTEYLKQAQRAFIAALLTLINCENDGVLRAKDIVDYLQKPEYVYLGPDENMQTDIIDWIANLSKKFGYKPGTSFISSKPNIGINHKEHGVTSLGVNVYMHEVLSYIGIDPEKDTFTIKISGGPDGDVAGNQIKNLHHLYPNTAKLIALTDISGTIHDPEGLDLDILVGLFNEEKSIKFYPPEKLSEGSFLLDMHVKRDQTAYAQQTLCWHKKNNKLMQDWLSGSEMNALFRNNVHQTPVDIFIPCGGRPGSLNSSNYQSYLDSTGAPTSKAIVEGANLYLTPRARRQLEDLGVLIIKDSSANKCGVIASSYEVLCGLTMSDQEMVAHHSTIVKEVLEVLEKRALEEATLLLTNHKEKGAYLSDLSDLVSEKINLYTYQLLDYLNGVELATDPNHPLVRCFLSYCLPILQEHFQEKLMTEIPESHKKAIIACHLASRMVYKKGLDWSPTVVEILPLLLSDNNIIIF